MEGLLPPTQCLSHCKRNWVIHHRSKMGQNKSNSFQTKFIWIFVWKKCWIFVLPLLWHYGWINVNVCIGGPRGPCPPPPLVQRGGAILSFGPTFCISMENSFSFEFSFLFAWLCADNGQSDVTLKKQWNTKKNRQQCYQIIDSASISHTNTTHQFHSAEFHFNHGL